MSTTGADVDSGTDSTTSDDAGPDPFRGESVRHSKEDALSDREFERMVEATYKFDDRYEGIESRLILFAAGRLGMRAGEITHLREEWIDWRRSMVTIPRHEPCTKGKDGGICGQCRQAAKQMVSNNDGLSQERAEAMVWSPKTESSAREIPFDAITRAEIAFDDYFDRVDQFSVSQTGINRRVGKTAELAIGVDADSVYPHCLRATAASFWAARNVKATTLKALMGWADFTASLGYIEESGERTAIGLRNIQL